MRAPRSPQRTESKFTTSMPISTDPDAIESLVDEVHRTQTGLDVLVNNAVVRHFAPVEAFAREAWDAALAVNISAAFHRIRLTLPGMRTRGWSRIFNMTSVYGARGTTNRIESLPRARCSA